MAVLDGDVRSVMHSYADIDGLPVAADRSLLTGLLRDEWGFDGTVVADYFGVAFLHLLHHVAGDLATRPGRRSKRASTSSCPTGDAYLAPLAAAVRDGQVDESLVDLAVTRALAQKDELGLLDATFDDEPPTDVALDGPEHRAIAARLAEESVVLLANDGTLPLAAPARVAVIGPNADRPQALFGAYSFINHVAGPSPGRRDPGRRPHRSAKRCGRVAVGRGGPRAGLHDRGRRRLRLRLGIARQQRVPTSPWSPSVTTPPCSAAARSARAATATTSSCPACSGHWWRRC